jgi:hypothetical protein
VDRLVFVHGINNQEYSAQRIRDDWRNGLKQVWEKNGQKVDLNRVQIDAAFYGDVLDEQTRTWDKRGKDVTEMSAEQSLIDDADVLQLYQEYQYSLGISDEAIMRYADSDVTEMGFPHKGWVKAVGRGLEAITPTRGLFLAKRFLPQAVTYLKRPGTADKIDALVKEQVFANSHATQRLLVIAHSLGTVVTYRLLRALGNQISVDLYITLGSPLGVRMFHKFLPTPRIRPSNVKRWINAADKNDFVALQTVLNRRTFGTDDIEKIDNIQNGEADPHSIIAYLSNNSIGQEVANFLTVV